MGWDKLWKLPKTENIAGKLNEWLEVNDVIENVGNYAEEAIQNDDNETVLSDLYGDKILVSQDCTEDDIRECFGINSKEFQGIGIWLLRIIKEKMVQEDRCEGNQENCWLINIVLNSVFINQNTKFKTAFMIFHAMLI